MSLPMKTSFSRIIKRYAAYCPVCRTETTHFSLAGSPVYCASCNERRNEERKRQYKAQAEAAFEQGLLAATGASKEHLHLAGSQSGEVAQALAGFAYALPENLRAGKNLFLYGTVGTGKTTAAAKLALKAFKAGYSVVYAKAYEALAGGGRGADLLVLDELHLAVRMFGDKASDEDIRALYILVEGRKNARKSTVFISNFDEAGLANTLPPPIFDRIFDKSRTLVLRFGGKSFREREKGL